MCYFFCLLDNGQVEIERSIGASIDYSAIWSKSKTRQLVEVLLLSGYVICYQWDCNLEIVESMFVMLSAEDMRNQS